MMIRRVSASIVLAACTAAFIACGNKVAVTPSNTANNSPANTNRPTATSGTSGDTPVTVTGKWEMVGKEGAWQGTVDMVGMDGFLWSVESDGSLNKTDPATGKYTQVGEKGSFHGLKHLEAMDHLLWTVEGSDLYKNDPNTAKWELLGGGGGWNKTVAMAGLNGILYSIEPDGSLWKTDKSGNDTQIDKGDFKGCSDLAAMNGKLWTIEDGNLYWTEPATLKWEQIGKEGEFKNITVMISGSNFLWMLDNGGTMYRVDSSGLSTVVGERGSYGQTTVLTTLNGKLWTVEGGSLYKTN